MKKTSISFTCLLLSASCGFSQQSSKNITVSQDQPVIGLFTPENLPEGISTADKPGPTKLISQWPDLQTANQACFPRKILIRKIIIQ